MELKITSALGFMMSRGGDWYHPYRDDVYYTFLES